MEKKKLGRAGVEVGIVGLGAAFIGVPQANLAPKVYPGPAQFLLLHDCPLSILPVVLTF